MTKKVNTEKSFTEHYKKLNDIAAKLRNGQIIDLDQLLPMVKEATQAYEKCKSRLRAVQLALNKHFSDSIAINNNDVDEPKK